MATKTELEITSGLVNRLGTVIHFSTSDDHVVWATWTSLKNAMLYESRYEAIGTLKIRWQYKRPDSAGGSTWMNFSEVDKSKTVIRNDPGSVPSEALAIRLQFKLIVSDKHKDKYTSTASWTTVASHTYSSVPLPQTPSEPTVSVDQDTLKVTVSQTVTDDTVTQVQFEIYTEVDGVQSSYPITSGMLSVPATKVVKYEFNATPGYTYYAKAVWYNAQGGSSESGGSGSAEAENIPSQIRGVSVVYDSISTVRVNWISDSAAASSNGYEIEKATEYRYLGTSQSESIRADGPPEIVSVNSGVTWWFRVRAYNRSGTPGAWSEAVSITMAIKPNPPTTWSLYSSYKLDDHIYLYWTYNTADGSKPTKSILYWRINQGTLHSKEIIHTYPETQTEFTFSYDLTQEASFEVDDGDRVTWYVVSYGIGPEASEPSIEREFVVYQTPEVWVTFPTTVVQYPFDIEINALPISQELVSGVINIYNINTYETINRYGDEVIINAGSIVYSQVFDGSFGNHFIMSLDPSNIELVNEEDYYIAVTITMNSGLTADNSNQSGRFTTNFERFDYILDSGVVFNNKTYAAALTPSCYYVDEDGEGTGELVPNFTLAVYRVNSDGTLVEITKDLPNDATTTVLDPHPSLDVPTYRIVGTDMTTGFMYYMNTYSEPTKVKGMVLEWDESYRNYVFGKTDTPEDYGLAVNGMILELPFNVKTSDSSNKDVELVDYIGREDPVSYYGTQQGKQATWSCEFDKADKETIFRIRHLDRWKGDVYVREQSGLGYWANVKVDYNIDYNNLVVPVTFQITKVDSNRP